MLPELRNRKPSIFQAFDEMFERALTDTWPAIQHRSSQSSFASYEDEDSYVLQVSLPQNVDAEQITAEVREGTLRITMPKPEARTIPVNVKEESIDGEAEETS